MIKKPRIIFSIILGIYFLTSSVILQPAFAKIKELKFIPKDSDVVIFIDNNPEDPGFSFVTGLWQKRFEIKETAEKKEAIDQIYTELPFGMIVGAVFLPEKAYSDETEPIYPEFIIVIETKGKEDIFRETLNILIKKRKPLKKLNYAGYKIIYRDKALEPYHGQKDLAAYAQIGNFFVIATTPEKLKLSIDTYRRKIDSISKNKEFLKLEKELSKGDAFIFANNNNGVLSDNLKRWEEKEGMRLLLSSGSINSAGLVFDLETEDALRGEIVFVPNPGEDIVNIKDDANFFAEVITRSFAKENINWISNVETTQDLVKLDFEGTGFKPIWEEALLKKRFVFLEKDLKKELTEGEGEIEVEVQASYNNLPKVIFVSAVVLLILGFILFLRRNKKS